MSRTQCAENFISNLKDEQDAIKDFIELLKKEEQALIQGKIDTIDSLATDKARIFNILNNFSVQRCQHLISQGLSPGKEGMNTCLARVADKNLEKCWSELLRLAQIAQTINHTNSLIVAERLQHTQRAWSALQTAAGNISLYGPKGQAIGISNHLPSGF